MANEPGEMSFNMRDWSGLQDERDTLRARVEAQDERAAIQYVEALEEAAAELRRAASEVEHQDECEAEALRSAARIVRALIERKANP